ncbi:MAG: hypothetical protein Alis3KO_04150 [Aliiglaciecola sp.]
MFFSVITLQTICRFGYGARINNGATIENRNISNELFEIFEGCYADKIEQVGGGNIAEFLLFYLSNVLLNFR